MGGGNPPSIGSRQEGPVESNTGLSKTASRGNESMTDEPKNYSFVSQQMNNVPQEQGTGRQSSPTAFDMSGIGSSLPAYQSNNFPQMPYQESSPYQSSTENLALYGAQQFHGPGGLGAPAYHVPPHNAEASAAHMYGQMQAAQRAFGPGQLNMHFAGTPYSNNMQNNFMYYNGQPGPMAAPSPYNQNMGHPGMNMPSRMFHSGYPGNPPQNSRLLRPDNLGSSRGNSNSSSGSIPSAPRGPPRKPKQSGHALWVGNLPSGTNVGDLKDHFSREATEDIESVFLISRSNCAFVNYRTDSACAAAMQRFHDSRFQGVRLVCRLRRGPNSAPGPNTPTVPGAPAGPSSSIQESLHPQAAPDAITQNRQISSRVFDEVANEARRRGLQSGKVPEKFFIMKSLTVEDMELSMRNKIWATQAHNEDALNKAYESAENVYLIFSANKSGEYFGVARMASAISPDVALESEWVPRSEKVLEDTEIPRSIPTSATEFAPRGRIIDDSARGTIFWEADHKESENVSSDENEPSETAALPKEAAVGAIPENAQSFGKPFKIEWVSVERIPFYRTRGLRNPWNANREVKIARDGTELETSVGRRLVMMFTDGRMTDPRTPLGPYVMPH